MAVYVLCLTASGGLPIFTRSSGDLKPLPYPVIGSLNGVHMFASNHDVSLLSSTTDDSKVVWKVFEDSITLIAVMQDDSADDCHLTNLLKHVYQSIVLLCGQESVRNIDKNVEKFKRDVKVCNHIVDRLIEGPAVTSFAELTNTVEIIAAPENAVLQNFLDAFTEAAESGYGCLLVEGKIAVATRKWWSLSANELVLLSLLISTMSKCTSRDLPVFLPDSHPTIPHRLMTFTLTDKIQVCVICGPSPTLVELQPEVIRFWKPGYESLRSICRLHPRNFPLNITLDPNLLGFLVVNKDNHRCLGSTNPSIEDKSATGSGFNATQRKQILHSFYKKVVGTFFTSGIEGSDTGPSEFTHQAQETYITTDTHKCYAMQSGSHQLYVLYNDSIPTYAMRSVTQKTLNLLTKDRHVHV